MSRTKASQLPADLAHARTRLEVWRKSRRAGQRIPKALWSTAAKLAKKHGVARTATVLNLDYYGLKRRVAETDRPASELTFVEVAPSSPSPRECVIEVEDGFGASMRVFLKGYDSSEVLALGHRLWNAE